MSDKKMLRVRLSDDDWLVIEKLRFLMRMNYTEIILLAINKLLNEQEDWRAAEAEETAVVKKSRVAHKPKINDDKQEWLDKIGSISLEEYDALSLDERAAFDKSAPDWPNTV